MVKSGCRVELKNFIFFLELLIDLLKICYVLNGSAQYGRFVEFGLISGNDILQFSYPVIYGRSISTLDGIMCGFFLGFPV